jgi:transposase InsO family protein
MSRIIFNEFQMKRLENNPHVKTSVRSFDAYHPDFKVKAVKENQAGLLNCDQGSRYTSKKYNLSLKKHKMNVSMSRKGNCYDNACIGSFFSHFKAECFYRYDFLEKTKVLKAIRRYMKHNNFPKKIKQP